MAHNKNMNTGADRISAKKIVGLIRPVGLATAGMTVYFPASFH